MHDTVEIRYGKSELSVRSQEQLDQLKALNYTYGCPGMQSDAVPGPRIHGDLNFEKDGFVDTYFQKEMVFQRFANHLPNKRHCRE